MANDKKRAVNWDLLRSLAMLFVVIVHTPWSTGAELAWGSADDWFITRIINYIAIICDPVFFMLSGYFALKASKRNLKDYYLNKVSTIILPMILYSIILYLYRYKGELATVSLGGYFAYFAELASNGWWFIPALVPCLVAAPFISKGLERLSDKNVFLIGAVLMVLAAWGLVMTFLRWVGVQCELETLSSFCSLMLELVPPGMLIGSIPYFQFFIMGGVFRRIAPYLRGRAGTIVIVVGMLFWVQDIIFALFYMPRVDPSYSWLFITFAIMTLFDRIRIEAKVPSRIITWTAKRSYSIYLLQYTTLFFSNKLFYELSIFGDVSEMGAAMRLVMYIVFVAVAYLLALLFASIGDTLLLANLQKLFNRVVYGKKKGDGGADGNGSDGSAGGDDGNSGDVGGSGGARAIGAATC